MPRFVLLYHTCPPHYERRSHWDLMLEAGKTLRTWALVQLPSDWNSSQTRTAADHPDCPPVAGENSVCADQLANHRLDYLEKEGPLSGDRGHVRRIDRGTYENVAETPGCWRVTLAGSNWRGRITLEQADADTPQWRLTVHHGSD